mmetsp:Transcript_6843/g.19513  ORF Transcript_6843/g.19513 Transcript_6843/m.19513 type:complete len:527 (-) Transcript_6843:197-1777(-)
MFDFDALDRLERLEAKAMGKVSVFKLKAIAMKFRHNTVGVTFARSAKALQKRKARKASILAKPLLDAEGCNEEEVPHVEEDDIRVEPDDLVGLKAILLHPFCVPLVCVPLGIASGLLEWGPRLTFWFNFLALIPLAKILGDATEELAASLRNDTLSGLLNATFGNAVEMIVSVQSIRAGLISVVKASLLGSVLSNILLVLGSSFFLGGWTLNKLEHGRYHSFSGDNYRKAHIGLEKEQKFPLKAALISLGMLLFACMTIVLPTLFDSLPTNDRKSVLIVSRIGSWITMSSYIAYLFFQLLTHKFTLAEEEKMEVVATPCRSMDSRPHAPLDPDGAHSLVAESNNESEDDDDDASPSLHAWVALALMAASTVVVALNSEFLVGSIQDAATGAGIPIGFVGVILLPLAGNACEHASALRFCMRDRPGLAIGIAVGSSTQVAMLVIPFSVLVAQAVGQPLDLDFGILNVAVLTFSVLVVFVLLIDGRSNWFKGYVLVAMYVFIAALYLYIPPSFGDDPSMSLWHPQRKA